MTTPPDPSPERRDPEREEPPARPANPPYGTSPGYGSYGGTPAPAVPGGGTSSPPPGSPATAPRPAANPAPSAPSPAAAPPSAAPTSPPPASSPPPSATPTTPAAGPATTPINRPSVTEPRAEPVPPKPATPPAGSSLGDAPPAAKIRTGPTATSPNAGGVAQSLRATGKPRRAKLVVRRLDPWSVLKFSLLFSICLLIVFVVAVAALYYALDSLGVFEAVNTFVRDITQAGGPEGRTTGGFDLTISPDRVIGGAAVIGAINVVIITAISTLAAFLYNLCSDIVGGIEVTLAERD